MRFKTDGVLISIESCCNTLSQEYILPRSILNTGYLPFTAMAWFRLSAAMEREVRYGSGEKNSDL